MVCVYCSPVEGGGVNPIPSSNATNSINCMNVERLEVSEEGIVVSASCLESFNFAPDTEVRCFIRSGYLVITNLPGKLKTLDGLEELLYRQDETKQDYSLPIAQLAGLV